MTQAERALKSATKEADRQAQSLDKLIGQIDPTVAAYSRLDKMEMQLQAHRKAGRLPTEDYNLYLKKLNETRNALAATDKAVMANTRGFNAQGLSAKTLAANLRNVPAQFTDIAVSLQAGQNPLTVFLQQGGQLKDMFGGIGPAARALGGYVVGLINPFTVAAAAAGVLALAYKQGSDEATAFQKAIILSGNAAGTSAGQLGSLAQSVSQSVGTVSAAADVLAQLAASSRIPVESFDMIAIAALKFQEATGTAADETVKNFEKIAKEPAKASRELNEALNYLTTSQYAQIEALERQGDVQAAANLAEQIYAEALTSRADKIVENLGYIEGAWKLVKDAAKGAWDAVLDVGREDTLEQKLKVLNDRLASIKAAEELNSRDGIGNLAPSDDFRREKTEREITDLLVQQEESRRRAAAKANTVAQDRAGIAAVEALNKGLDETASKQEKLAKRYAEIDKQVAAAAARGVKYSEAQITQLRKAAEAQFAEPKGPKPKAAPVYREDAGMRMLDTLRQQGAALQLQSEANDKLGTQAQALARFQQEIADIKSKQIQTADQKALVASEDLITAQLKRNVAIEQELALRKENAKALSDYEKLAQSLGKQENKALQVTKERFALLEKARAAGLGAEKYQQTSADIAAQSTSKVPNFPGLDPSVGGAGGELEKLDKAQQDLEDWYSTQLDMLDEFRSSRADLMAEWDAKEREVKQQHEDTLEEIERARGRAQLAMASEVFGNIATLSQSENKKLAAIGKAAAIAQATVDGFLAVQKALAAFPPPFNFVAAAAVGVATAANVANIAGVGFESGGYTGDGGSSQPAGIVHKGEYVFTKAQTAAIGVANLEAIARNGYQDGGYVTMPRTSTASTSAKLDRTLADINSGSDTRGGRTDNRRTTVNQTIQVTGAVDRRTATQLELEASRRQRIAQARLG